jgi:hypothetical protein
MQKENLEYGILISTTVPPSIIVSKCLVVTGSLAGAGAAVTSETIMTPFDGAYSPTM